VAEFGGACGDHATRESAAPRRDFLFGAHSRVGASNGSADFGITRVPRVEGGAAGLSASRPRAWSPAAELNGQEYRLVLERYTSPMRPLRNRGNQTMSVRLSRHRARSKPERGGHSPGKRRSAVRFCRAPPSFPKLPHRLRIASRGRKRRGYRPLGPRRSRARRGSNTRGRARRWTTDGCALMTFESNRGMARRSSAGQIRAGSFPCRLAENLAALFHLASFPPPVRLWSFGSTNDGIALPVFRCLRVVPSRETAGIRAYCRQQTVPVSRTVRRVNTGKPTAGVGDQPREASSRQMRRTIGATRRHPQISRVAGQRERSGAAQHPAGRRLRVLICRASSIRE